MNNATRQLLERHFDTAFLAPDGIAKLRELILTLAMQGKLVEQDPNDQPASELLKEIEAEKQRLVKAGKIKAPKALPPVKPEEVPYELPPGWQWVRLGEITGYNGRKNISGDGISPNTWLLDLEDIEKGTSRILNRAKFSERQSKSTKSTFQKGDVLYGKLRPYLDKVVVADTNGVCTTEIVPIVPFNGILPEFLRWLLKRPAFLAHVNSLMYGVKMPRLGTDDAVNSIHPLPPYSEQHRIVARIDQLMARCDELEKLRKARDEKRLAVHAAAIKKLLENQEGSAWHFIQQHFSELYSVKENVAKLRKAILQLAVDGILVADNHPLRSLPLEAMLIEASRNGVSKGPVDDQSATEVLRISAGTSRDDFYVNEDDFKHVQLLAEDIEKFRLQPDDLLACRFNGNLHFVGRFSLYRGVSGRTQVNPDKLIRFRIDKEAYCPRYVCYAMNASSTRAQIESMCATTAGNIGVSAGRLKTVQIPAPSLSQQHRIVAKVDQLMALCDTLEKQIEVVTVKQSELLAALLHARPHQHADITDLAAYRSAIGCYVVRKLANTQYFGRTAAAKLMYLAQAHVGLTLGFHPAREAAGPLDKWIYDFERQGQSNGWFEVNEKTLSNDRKKTEYRCLSALSEPSVKAQALMSGEQQGELDRLIYAMADKRTEDVEIIATLFAVWNDFLIDGIQPTDEQIIADVRENWHERKARFSPSDLKLWLAWLRKENFVPRGLPPRTVQQQPLGI